MTAPAAQVDDTHRCFVCRRVVPVLVEGTDMCISCDARVVDAIYGAAS